MNRLNKLSYRKEGVKYEPHHPPRLDVDPGFLRPKSGCGITLCSNRERSVTLEQQQPRKQFPQLVECLPL